MGNDFLEEDEGFDLNAKKPTLEELEQEAIEKIEQERKETKHKIKNISKYLIPSVIVIVAITMVIIIGFFKSSSKQKRDLPFENEIENNNNVQQLGETDYKEGQFYVEDMQEQGVILSKSSILQTPSPYGYVSGSVESGEEVEILGEVFENETNKEVNYFSVNYKDIKGYINKDNVDIIWVDDCDLEPEIEKTIEESTEEIDIERQAFNDDKFLRDLQKLDDNSQDLQEELAEINETLSENEINEDMTEEVE